ncbi:unnamed protein product, partial [Polarella glacialis]
ALSDEEPEHCPSTSSSAAPAAAQSAEETEVSFPTSSPSFERFRTSLRAQHGPLFARFTALLTGERGISSGANLGMSTLGLGKVSAAVSAMVQLADLRLQQQNGSVVATADELGLAAVDLFDALCSAVKELPSSAPEVTASFEAESARAAALFRMKDTISSLYAWGLMSRATCGALLATVKAEVKGAVKFIDPITGTGLHGLLLREAGAEVVLADSVAGGSTQSSGSDMYIHHCSSTGPTAMADFPKSSSAIAVGGAAAAAWAPIEMLDVFDCGPEANNWWLLHGGSDKPTTDDNDAEKAMSVLLLSFPPPPPSSVAEATLRRFQGHWLLFVGEWRGCTGAPGFFDLLDAGWERVQTFELPRWPMMEDSAYLLRRRPVEAV